MRSRLGMAFAAALAFMLLAAPADATETRKGAALKFEDSSHDFTSVFRGETLTHRFGFVNAGDAPLSIQGVHAACGCTAVEVDKGRRYAPGERGFVEVKLDTTDFAGSIVKSVTVMSNEKLLPDRTLTLKAFVKTEIDAVPPLADFGDVNPKTGAVRTVILRPLEGFKVDVKDLVFNDKALDATVQKQGQEHVVTVRLKEGLAPGFLKETVIVRNNSSHLKELPIPVRANVKGSIDVAPAYLEFGAIAARDSARRSITMKGVAAFDVTGSRTELLVNGRKVDDPSRFIKVETLPAEKEKRLVAVELRNAAALAGSVHGKLFLKTSDPDQRELAVDFYAFFR